MMNGFVASVANHLWQSTIFAGAMWGVARVLRRNSASVRYGVWMAASVKFLVPFALLVGLGSHFAWRPAVTAPAAAVVEEIGQPFEWVAVGGDMSVAATHVPEGEGPFGKLRAGYGAPEFGEAVPARVSLRERVMGWLPEGLLAVWMFGVLAGIGFWVRWMLRMRDLRRAGTEVEMGLPVRVMTSGGQMEPCVFGLWRPVLMLPEGIGERLTAEELDAVIAHEMSHVRRRDHVTSAVHVLVETVFWFWPVLRWVRARLLEERERACDEAVLRGGSEPRVYAEGILKVCRWYVAPEPMVAAGVSGARLRERIEAIVSGREAMRMSAGKRTLLVVAGVITIGAPVILGQRGAALQAASREPVEVAAKLLEPVMGSDVKPMMMGAPAQDAGSTKELPIRIVGISLLPSELAQQPLLIDEVPRGCAFVDQMMGYSSALRIRSVAGALPGSCIAEFFNRMLRLTPEKMLEAAYGVGAGQIAGTPAWAGKTFYDLELKAEVRPQSEMFLSEDPRLQAERTEVFQPFVKRRFGLTAHMDTRTMPVYELVRAAGGVKFERLDANGDREGIEMAAAGGRASEKFIGSGKVMAHGASIQELAALLAVQQGMPVVDKTGLDGRYDFTLPMRLEEVAAWEQAESHAGAGQRPVLYSELEERFGLKLVKTMAPVPVLVVDQMQEDLAGRAGGL